MELTKELIEKAKNCQTAEELTALAQENGFELSLEGAEFYLQDFEEGALSDEELDNVAGGVEGIKIGEPYERVIWKTREEVQFIFNVGDQVQVFPSWCRHRPVICKVIGRRVYAIGCEKYVDQYYLEKVKGYDWFVNSWHYRDQIEM